VQVKVWLGGSLYRCCGPSFVLGDQVFWTVTAASAGPISAMLGAHAPSDLLRLPVLSTIRTPDDDRRGGGVVVGAGDLQVFISSRSGLFPVPGGGGVRVGLLVEDHHVPIAAGVPPTRGRVTAIEEVRARWADDSERRGLVPQPDSALVRQVSVLEHDVHDGADAHRFAGWLVTLDVDSDIS
jgi:hypothetical protein